MFVTWESALIPEIEFDLYFKVQLSHDGLMISENRVESRRYMSTFNKFTGKNDRQ